VSGLNQVRELGKLVAYGNNKPCLRSVSADFNNKGEATVSLKHNSPLSSNALYSG
jgi:hypothetical protein